MATTDGRLLRRERNREAVVEALLDLYQDGNLRPSTEEIAARSGLSPRSLFRYFDDVDDLTRAAMQRQQERVQPLVPIDTEPGASLEVRVRSLVEQRFRLFDMVGNAAIVSRLRSPFQPVLATQQRQTHAYLRKQIALLFTPELAAMETAAARAVLTAADLMTTFEAYQLLTGDQAVAPAEAQALICAGLMLILQAPVDQSSPAARAREDSRPVDHSDRRA
jgi:AcrR family transcriptional regulator